MSSHREAPEISKDPVADSADLYAFVSPDAPDMVTLIANYIPLQAPAGGPNFFEFGDDVEYAINIDNNGDAKPDITYTFRFDTHVRDATSFLYNVGQIKHLNDKAWNRPQNYTVSRTVKGKTTRIGRNLRCPPCNIGPRSTPDYPALAAAAVHRLGSGETVFAGQRRDGFYVDLGAIFDLADLRPFSELHLLPPKFSVPGVNSLTNSNVHSIALQVPITHLTAGGVIGVWTTASRQKSTILEADGTKSRSGPFVQVSRLGNPLINEVIIPMAKKDFWNTAKPWSDRQFASYYAHPSLVGDMVELYPGVFPNLKLYSKARADLEAILLTGIRAGLIPGFANFTGPTQADMLRLNTAIPPTPNPNILGLIGGDPAGFPNGRRYFDDVVSIELRCAAGLTIPLVDNSYTPDAAAGQLTDGLTPASTSYQDTFPYLDLPLDGYDHPSS
jgi:hypothetical protein